MSTENGNDEHSAATDCSTVFHFDADKYCLIYCGPHSGVVQMTGNISDAKFAEYMAETITRQGGHVFRAVPAGVLVAALELIKRQEQVVRNTWECGCGTTNGVNLPVCRVCGRKEGEQ